MACSDVLLPFSHLEPLVRSIAERKAARLARAKLKIIRKPEETLKSEKTDRAKISAARPSIKQNLASLASPSPFANKLSKKSPHASEMKPVKQVSKQTSKITVEHIGSPR